MKIKANARKSETQGRKKAPSFRGLEPIDPSENSRCAYRGKSGMSRHNHPSLAGTTSQDSSVGAHTTQASTEQHEPLRDTIPVVIGTSILTDSLWTLICHPTTDSVRNTSSLAVRSVAKVSDSNRPPKTRTDFRPPHQLHQLPLHTLSEHGKVMLWQDSACIESAMLVILSSSTSSPNKSRRPSTTSALGLKSRIWA